MWIIKRRRKSRIRRAVDWVERTAKHAAESVVTATWVTKFVWRLRRAA